jgi:predicted nicotinamide N-methyase
MITPMFFDDNPEFLDTSSTANSVERLNMRHVAMFEEYRDVLKGARVLDIASHDGRWSYAALDAGAAHVTGVEGRDYLVENAKKTFTEKGIDASRFTFINGDAHDVLTEGIGTFDVVMCLGFIYHTLRYAELFAGIRKTGAQRVLIDTRVSLDKKPVISVYDNPVEKESMAVEDRFSNKGKTLAGSPSMPALSLMLNTYDYDVIAQTDWYKVLQQFPGKERRVKRYVNGGRVTLLAALRD